jgi:CheY-like chemotaxis protein
MSSKKIFVVDDDQDILDSLELILTHHGYEVTTSVSTKKAVEIAVSDKPDLVIMDVMFPENSSEGFELAREFNKNDQLRKIPIVMLSAVNARFKLGFSNRDRGEDWLPVAEFMEKPIEPSKLLEIVERLLA